MKIEQVERLRIKALARRALHDGNSPEAIVQRLIKDDYFDETKKKLGQEKTLQILYNVVENAKEKEQERKAWLENNKSNRARF